MMPYRPGESRDRNPRRYPTPGMNPAPIAQFPEVTIIRSDRHPDDRGWFSEVFRAEWLPGTTFVQDNESYSEHRGTVRGLHFQSPPAAQVKLVRVVTGRILDVVVDIRRASPLFGRHATVELTADGGEQLLVPVGFAHGFVTLEASTRVAYKVTAYHSPELDAGIRWDDPALGIDWGVTAADAVVSPRDVGLPRLGDIDSPFRYGVDR
jgi:dTDP-4-dehydrorhamnose 3,5-epimerase